MKRICIPVITAVCLSSAANAGEIGLYVQGNAGTLNSDLNDSMCQNIGNVTGISYVADSSKCSTKGPSGKLLVGYKVAPHFALEATYFAFGKEEYTAYLNNTEIIAVTNKLTAYGLGAAVDIDVTDKWSVIGRFGFARTRNKISYETPPNGASGDVGSETHPKYYMGGSLAYEVTPLIKLHGDLDYTKVRIEGLDEHGIRLLSVGASLNF